jgi:ADP-heptose:LPS heptosyltransferase
LKRLLRTIILLVIRLLGAPGARKAAQFSNKTLTTPRILLVRPDHLGDLLMTTPVLHVLKKQAPDSYISIMVGPWSSEVIARHPDIDRILTCPFPGFQRTAQKALAPYTLLFNTAKQLRRGHFDIAINLRPDFWWGAALLYLARIPRRVGYALEPGKPFLTNALPFHSPEHATVSNLRLASAALQSMGYPPLNEPYTPEHYPLSFTPTTDDRKWATTHLQNEGISPSYVGAGFTPARENLPVRENLPTRETPARENHATLIIIHPGSGAAVKLWRTEGWASCADALTKLLTRATSVCIMLTGSKNERPMLEEIASSMQSPAILVTNATIGQLAALQAKALLVLSVDSGPLHLAVSQGTPTIQLFGPTDSRIFGPWGKHERHIVLASTHRCPTCTTIPCGRLDFSPQEVTDHPCVRLITEQQVLSAINELIPLLT